MIPREGVESLTDVERYPADDRALVIPREGVESLSKLRNTGLRRTFVIPREGVESIVDEFIELFTSENSDPERGS